MISKLPASGSLQAVYFSTGITPNHSTDFDCVTALCNLIREAEKSIDISIYSLTHKKIVDSLIEAQGRRVPVRIVADATQAKGKAMSQALKRLQGAGSQVRVASKQKAAMHNKVCIFDRRIVAAGSFNLTVNAAEHNDEFLIVFEGAVAEDVYENCFKRVWD